MCRCASSSAEGGKSACQTYGPEGVVLSMCNPDKNKHAAICTILKEHSMMLKTSQPGETGLVPHLALLL